MYSFTLIYSFRAIHGEWGPNCGVGSDPTHRGGETGCDPVKCTRQFGPHSPWRGDCLRPREVHPTIRTPLKSLTIRDLHHYVACCGIVILTQTHNPMKLER